MLRMKWLLVCGGVGLLTSTAFAFQESKGGNADGQQQSGASKAAEPQLDLRNTGVSVAPSTGVEVRIPGLGKLGVLPKFDFGLELLYGANEQKTQEINPPLAPADDVQIRGSLKHRF